MAEISQTPADARMPSAAGGEERRSIALDEFWRRVDDGAPPPSGPIKLIVPGLHDSGDGHWQTLWQRSGPDWRRVDLGQWSQPLRELWVSRLDRAVAREREPVVLVAHSLGCLAVAWWAAEASDPRLAKVRAAMLVAPPDVDRADADSLLRPFGPAPRARLPFPTLVVASRDDRYCDFERSTVLARRWRCDLVDAGHAGHINAESKLGDWPEGRGLLDQLLEPNSSRPISMRRTSLVPAPMSSSLASR